MRKLATANMNKLDDPHSANWALKDFCRCCNSFQRTGYWVLVIDRLCIVQDNLEDWLRESERMQSVYANAFLNLAATAERNGDGGLLIPRDPLIMKVCIVQAEFDIDGKRPGPTYCLNCLYHDTWNLDVTEAPLDSRAWVIQERFLSKRILHFSYSRLYWECYEKTYDEGNYPSTLYQNTKTTEMRSLLQHRPLTTRTPGVHVSS